MTMLLPSFLHIAPRPARTDCISRLHAAAAELARLTSGTEGDFLTIGEALRNFSIQTRELSKLSSSVAERMAGAEVTEAMVGLQEIFGRIGQLDDESGRGKDALLSILESLRGIRSHLLGFEKTVRNLHALCSSIKIETARSGRGNTGFDTLSDDVKSLARNIESQSIRLLEQAAVLTDLIGQNLEKIRNFEDRQHQQARRILDDAAGNLAILREKHGLSTEAMRAFSARWERLSGNIGEVVSSLQFHDITRQRIEHVGEALNELADRLRPSGANGNGKGLSWPPWGSGRGKIAKGRSEGIGFAADACALQGAQLRHARDEFVAAVHTIIDNTVGISRNVEKMSDEAHRIAGVTDNGGRSFLAGVDGGIASLIRAVSDYVGVNRDLSAALYRVTEMVEQMSVFVTEIEKIGIEMKMVAVNASIHAAHIGEEGLALGVLADALHPLSLETSRQIGDIAGSLKSIIAASRALSDKLSGNAADETGDTENLADRLGAMMTPLHRLDEDNVSLLARLDGEVGTLSGDIETLIAAISVHDRIDQAVNRVNGELTDIIAEMRSAAPADASQTDRSLLHDFSARYTMDKERDIHQSVIAQRAAAAAGPGHPARQTKADERRAEIGSSFGEAQKTETAPSRTQEAQPEELGDNVELF